MQNEIRNADNKLNNIRPNTENKKKIIVEQKKNKNTNIFKKNCNNIPHKINNFNINNNKNIFSNNTKTTINIPKIKKITQNYGNFHSNNINKKNDYNNNLFDGMDKQYTPVLKNENDLFQFFNINQKGNYIKKLNLKEEKILNAENINFHKRSKSSNKPYIKLDQIKNKKENIKNFNNYKYSAKNKKNPSLFNKNKKEIIKKKENSPKFKKNNIQVINISPNKKVILPGSIYINKIPNDKKIPDKNYIKNIKNNINENNIQIKNVNNDNANNLNNNSNNQINFKTPPYISYAMHDNPNTEYRKEMEDFHNFQILSLQNIVFTYFSIFDGHSGAEVPTFLRDYFHIYLIKELKTINITNDSESNHQKIISSINNSFHKIDKDIIDNQNFNNQNGSTGTIILLYRDPNNPYQRIIICANVGDSKGYIINKNKIKKITKDHICSDDNEVKRIKNNGGVVFNGRVFGMLMLTRSFGDKEFKECGVLATPNIYSGLIEDDDLYVVIASDGVWDTISQDDLFKLSKEKMSSKEFSEKIVVSSLNRGTRDNISCFVIKLNSN